MACLRFAEPDKSVRALNRPLHHFGTSIAVLAAMLCLPGPAAYSQVTTEAGLNDLVILDPGKHERGLPAVVLERIKGRLEIDVPPTIHVHRYYYSGDKIFQTQIINGGPIILVANHPRTGERMYVDAVLPPGTPRVQHTKSSINYIYPDRRVEIKFQHFPFDPCVAVVKHHSGRGFGIAILDKHKELRKDVNTKLTNSQVVNSLKDAGAEGADIVVGACTAIGDFSTQGADTFKQLSDMIPGVTYLKSLSEQRPQHQYESSVQRADIRNARQEIPFVRTNR